MYEKSLREYAMKVFNLKKMKLLIKEQQNHMKMQKCIIFVEKILKINMWKIKHVVKLEIIVIIQGNIEVLHIVLHNESNSDYHFIIKNLAEDCKKNNLLV